MLNWMKEALDHLAADELRLRQESIAADETLRVAKDRAQSADAQWETARAALRAMCDHVGVHIDQVRLAGAEPDRVEF
jgi:hypothetical protein